MVGGVVYYTVRVRRGVFFHLLFFLGFVVQSVRVCSFFIPRPSRTRARFNSSTTKVLWASASLLHFPTHEQEGDDRLPKLMILVLLSLVVRFLLIFLSIFRRGIHHIDSGRNVMKEFSSTVCFRLSALTAHQVPM